MSASLLRARLAAPAAAGLVLALAACAPLQPEQKPAEPPRPVAPQITEDTLRERARQQLGQGVKQYEAGDYDASTRNLSASLDHGLLGKAEQSTARKYLAFIHCAAGREVPCRDEFRKAFEIDRDFSLSAAEDGHPIWGPVYRDVRTQLIMEREAAQARTRPTSPLTGTEQGLADGLVKYHAGDYEAAIKLLEACTKEGLPQKADQVRALKHLAFSQCLKDRYRDCRATFVRIYDVDRDFDLTPAEAGHPSWTKTFAGAKAEAKRALAAKDAKEAKEKAASTTKAPAPPAAAVPKKN